MTQIAVTCGANQAHSLQVLICLSRFLALGSAAGRAHRSINRDSNGFRSAKTLGRLKTDSDSSCKTHFNSARALQRNKDTEHKGTIGKELYRQTESKDRAKMER